MVKYLFLIGLVLSSHFLRAQTVQDSLPAKDTVKSRLVTNRRPPVLINPIGQPDSTLSNTRRDTIIVAKTNFLQADSFLYTAHPYFRFTHPTRYTISVRQWQGKEAIFYSLIGLLIFFALIKNSFQRYIQDLFKIFFRTTVRQRQIKDQLVQSPFPSLLLNIFFTLSIGMFVALLIQYFGLGRQFGFWMLLLYCVGGLVAIYAVKYLALKFMGWILQVSEAVDAYIFIVFTANKILGIALLPFVILLAFSYGMVCQVAVSLGIILALGLLAYRYFLSYISVHRQIKINFFHFVLYLCAFEIAPLLLINKLLFTVLS
jgi:hypothetical protein